ncbi:MAG TPA: LuxR family transcriptional regulator [Acidimicrobiales bacterium]|nr:LuxR family transcriptional regulator [Acidimicrobiales bacterium]
MTAVDQPVGREDEMKSLASMLDDVAAAQSRVTVLTGDAGLGKSVLVDWAIGEARQRGFTVLRATGIEFEQALAFSGLSAVVRPLLDRLDALDASQARALRGALGLVDADGRLLMVHGATLALVSAAAENTPVLVAIDDAQWLDQSSLESLVFAAHRCEADRVGFLFAQRSGLPCLLDRTDFDRLDLRGLPREAAVELLGQAGVADEVAGRCWELTRGNPLALMEAGRGLTPGQCTGAAPLPAVLPIGDRLVDSFGAQLAKLPDATLTALGAAALVGDDDVATLARALDRVGSRVAGLAPAESSGVVRIVEGRVTWRHPLMRAAVLHLLDIGRQRELHRALAEAAGEVGQHEAALWHLSESVVGPDHTVAEQMVALGGAASRRGALAAAIRAYEQAARLTTDRTFWADSLMLAALACFTSGDHVRARDTLAPVIETVEDPLAKGRMAAVLGQAEIWLKGPAAAIPRFELHALALREDDPGAAALLLLHGAGARLINLDLPGALDNARRAAEAAEEDGDLAVQLAAQACIIVLELCGGSGEDPAERMTPIAQLAIAVFGPDNQLDGVEGVLHLCAFAYMVCDDAPAAIDLLRQLIHQGDTGGLSGRSAFSRLMLVECMWRVGWWAEAAAEMSQLISLQRAVGLGHLVPLSYAELARIEAGLGQEEECRSHAAQAVDAAWHLGIGQIGVYAVTAIGLLELGAGRFREAAEAMDEIADATAVPEPGWLWWQADYIEALAGAGRTDDARAHLAILERQAQVAGRVWPTAAAHRCAALLGEGDPEERFAAALDGFRSIKAVFEEARTLLARGEHRLRAGGRADGARDLATARTMFDRLGARSWSQRASAARGEATSTTRSLASRLTEAELRVALAVGHGLSNRQAAEQLFVSVKTVDFHLQGIYRKLGIRNRTQLAAIVLSNGAG